MGRGNYMYGFADLRDLLPSEYSKYRYGIVLGRKLEDEIIDSIRTGPNYEYLRHYRAVNRELTDISQNIAAKLQQENISTMAIAPTLDSEDHTEEYNKTLRLNFSHKLVATRAGLGWIGKTALFVSRRWGPRLRLVSLLTDYCLEVTGPPVERSECGDCNLCVKHCPAGAASGQLWDIHLDRDQFYNAFKCRETCLSFKISDSPICGICVSVCPLGKK